MIIRPETPGRLPENPGSRGGVAVGHPVDVASGEVFSIHKDFSIPGRFPLAWERRYSTGLLALPSTPLGPGWTCPYFAKLTRVGKDWRFTNPEGSVEVFPDPDDGVARGEVIRRLEGYAEIAKHGQWVQVTRWNPDGPGISRFLFFPGRNGEAWPLRILADATGQGLELSWSEQGHLRGIRQQLEKRTLAVSTLGDGRIVAVAFRHGDGRTQSLLRFEYDSRGNLAAAFDAMEQADRYEYDKDGRMVRELVKDGGVFSFKYDEKGRCIRTWGLDNYDFKSLRYLDHIGWTEVTDSYGNVKRYQWLPTGQVVLELNPLGGQTKTEYDALGRIIAKINPTGGEVRFEYDAMGNRCKVVDLLGGEEVQEFNPAHLPVKLTNAAGLEFKREYDASNRLVKAVGPAGEILTYAYDRQGNLTQAARDGAVLQWSYGENGLLLESRDPAGYRSTYAFDAFGRMIGRIGPMGDAYRWGYDALGRLTLVAYPDGSTVHYGYDAGGNLATLKDARDRTARYNFGPCGRLLSISDPEGRLTRFLWGTEPGRLLAIFNAKDEEYRFAYNANGKRTSVRDFAGIEQRYEYDAGNRLVAWTNGMGERIEYELDAASRAKAIILPDGSRCGYAYDKAGHLESVSNADAEVTFDRDPLGRILKETTGDFSVEYAYDPLGRLERTSTNLGFELAYGYDARGHLTSVAMDGQPVLGLVRNPLGAEIRRNLPGTLRMEQTLDALGRMSLQRVVAGPPADAGSPAASAALPALIQREYAWDGLCVVGVRDLAWGKTLFAYDAAERLLRAAREFASPEAFQYDATGNITGTLRGSASEDAEYGPGNRLVRRGRTRYAYDGNGRLARKTVGEPGQPDFAEWTYRWDAFDRLRALTTPSGETWEYRYDPLGRRIGKSGPRGRVDFHWDRDTLIQERVDGKPGRAWIFDLRTFQPFGERRKGTFHPLITDHLGTPREMLDAEGKVLWSATYEAWGRIESETGPDFRSPWRFQGQWYDEESGLHYNRFRYYDPEAGRYVSPDPIGLLGGLNPYRYTVNPVNWIDPLGLDWNYVLTDENGDVYYTGVASDNASTTDVERRHAGTVGEDGPRFRREPWTDPNTGITHQPDTLHQVTQTGTNHEAARGMEQAIATEFGTTIGRRGSDSNPDGNVRGNLQNPVDPNAHNAASRAQAAQGLVDEHDTTVRQMVEDAIENGAPTCGGS
jgi:RHS repeat-associated protein